MLKKKCYKWVEAQNLTPEELRASRLPNRSIIAIWVNFTGPAKRNYTAVHVYKHPYGPYVLLSCDKEKGFDLKGRIDFLSVETTIARELEVRRTSLLGVYDRGDDFCKVIPLRKRPTQARIAALIGKYTRYFEDVGVSAAYFHDVPKSTYKNSGIPLEKLVFEN